jgi:phenylalanine-4-hydroxylase
MIKDMDSKLRDLGWGAVPVCGFIPPAAFLEFQSLKILPIAYDMRSIDHVGYTPAPDIVHEAAGHAPILADQEYSDYLTRYASMAKKAILSHSDLQLYEAIRILSDLKENSDSTGAEIAQAEAALKAATAKITKTSEAAKVTRMNWWTVEYGLLGSLKEPRIYGAGLLSSVRESQNCLSPKVAKIRLSVACVDQAYDITEPQPQLFVAESISHLKQVLEEFEATLAYKRGGVFALKEGHAAGTVTTTLLDSGLEVSGIIDDMITPSQDTSSPQGERDRTQWVRWRGPCQLAYQGQILEGQGIAQHPHGFSTVLGRAASLNSRPLATLSDGDLAQLGLYKGEFSTLLLSSGFQIEGELVQVVRGDKGQILVMKWKRCTVKKSDRIYFQPDWGDFDWAVGESVLSVSGGPSDPSDFGMFEMGTASTSPARTSPYSPIEVASFAAYQEVRDSREHETDTLETALFKAESLTQEFPKEWLLRLDALELAVEHFRKTPLKSIDPAFKERLHLLRLRLVQDFASSSGDTPWLVGQGLGMLGSVL